MALYILSASTCLGMKVDSGPYTNMNHLITWCHILASTSEGADSDDIFQVPSLNDNMMTQNPRSLHMRNHDATASDMREASFQLMLLQQMTMLRLLMYAKAIVLPCCFNNVYADSLAAMLAFATTDDVSRELKNKFTVQNNKWRRWTMHDAKNTPKGAK